MLKVFTDGSAKPNPGYAGSGAILVRGNDVLLELVHPEGPQKVGNGRAEVRAVTMLFPWLPTNEPVTIYTDSTYVRDGINLWLPNWVKRGWKTASNKTPENVDLWRELWGYKQNYPNVKIEWIKAHAGHKYNERADYLANLGSDRSRQEFEKMFLKQ